MDLLIGPINFTAIEEAMSDITIRRHLTIIMSTSTLVPLAAKFWNEYEIYAELHNVVKVA